MGRRVDSEILWTAERKRKDGAIRFTYTGGEYIDVSFSGYACDVINVFDYVAGKTTVTEREQFLERTREYLSDKENIAAGFGTAYIANKNRKAN